MKKGLLVIGLMLSLVLTVSKKGYADSDSSLKWYTPVIAIAAGAAAGGYFILKHVPRSISDKVLIFAIIQEGSEFIHTLKY